MPLSFLKKKKSPIWERIEHDDITRLRTKYDTIIISLKIKKEPVTKDGKEYVMLSSNDYLGSSHHPKIKEVGRGFKK